MAANEDPWLLSPVPDDGDPSPDDAQRQRQASHAPPKFDGYEIGKEIGRGGMGIVYKAQQIRANRTVALKVIHPKFHDRSSEQYLLSLERFRTEGQAAARVEHDNVVAVYDVGEQAGRAFFAMRFIEGQSLSQLLRDGPLDNRTAARIMLDVALGVDACHQAGILHRDLKPGNVLLDSANDRALVSDFGLAKLLDTPSDLTEAGHTPATPMYASPEQLRDSKSVTASSDIYSLGATLYHILTGRPPFYTNSSTELLHQVYNDEPIRPTTLNPAVSRDLETICLKCLEKASRARYESARHLANDLERYRHDEPIQARPITRLNRIIKWAKRRPAVASLIAALAIITIVGFVAVTWQWQRAERALELAAHERTRTEHNFDLASNALDSIIEFADDPRLESYGLEGYRRDMFARVRPFYEQLVEQKGDDAYLLAKQASAYYGLGRMADVLGDPAARESYEESAKLYSRLVKLDPFELKYQLGRARALRRLSRLHMRSKRYGEAESASRTAIDNLEEVDKELRRDTDYQFELAANVSRLAHVLLSTNRVAEAEPLFRQSLLLYEALAPEKQRFANVQNELADAHTNLGMVYLSTWQPDKALDELREAVRLLDGLLTEFPENLEFNNDLCVAYHHLARCFDMLAISEHDPAMQKLAFGYFDKLIAERKRLALSHPAIVELQLDLARGYFQFGESLSRAGDFQRAKDMYLDAYETYRRLVKDFGYSVEHVVPSLQRLGEMHRRTGQFDEARKRLQRGIEILTPLVHKSPNTSDDKSSNTLTVFLSACYLELGRVDIDQDMQRSGIEWITQAINLLNSTLSTSSARERELIAIAYDLRAHAFEQLGEVEKARADRQHSEQWGSPSPR